MNVADGIVAAVFLLAFLFGCRRGLIMQLISLLGLFLAWLCAFLFHDDLEPWITRFLPEDAFSTEGKMSALMQGLQVQQHAVSILSFLLIFLAVKLGLSVVGHVLNVLAMVPGLRGLNRLGGGIFGLAEAAVLIFAVTELLLLWPNETVQRMMAGSVYVDVVVRHVGPMLSRLWPGFGLTP